ncbi:FecR family protein [Tenacibaculum bernardetii]|uniref:FecR family protein n=1 Tax=Tenacibaculum bernardetii TaxID=3021375 RepID=UPI0023AEB24A|nr:FecR family protein [Tenacibaculum bernardetii]
MKQEYNDETFLARWIANDLSSDELNKFKDSEDYHQYKKINDASQLLKAPHYNKETVLNKIKEEKSTKKKPKKVFKLSPSWMYSAAASIILLLTVFYINKNNTSNFSSAYGEQIIIKLPDNSTAYLSPGASLEFDKKNWSEKRDLFLTGEAYFEVERGKSFTVNSKQGKVVVLGTRFTVNTSNNFFEVQCFEGKVKATSKNNSQAILTKGKAFRVYDNKNENWEFSKEKPSWLKGESNFNNAPLHKVILTLEKRYNLKFNTNKIDVNRRFTGAFTNNDVNIALKTVFAPMKISFKLAENSSVVLTSDE